jgi:hypothetical protein
MKIGPKDEILLSGFFSFSADFDPGPGTFSLSSQGNDDAFVASYDSSGSFQWALGLGSTSNDVGRALAVDEQGQVFVSGYFLNQVDFDPGPGTAILDGVGGDAFVAAYDSAGSYQWAEKLGGTRFDVGQALALGPDSLLLNGGRFIGMVDLDPGPGLFPVQDFDNNGSSYVVGLDKNSGSFRKGFATEDQRGGDDDARALLSDSQGNYFLGGSFSGEVDFDPGGGAAFLDGAGHRGGFIAKYDSLDQLLWAKAFVSTDFAWVEALAQDAYGNLLACGQFQGRVDFDPGADSLFLSSTPGFISRPDLFILKLDPQGNLLWARSLGGSDFEAAYDLVVDGKQDVLVTGYFRQTVDFDPGPGTASLSGSNRDAFVLKLDSAGLYQWAFQLGGSSNDYGYALEVDSLDNFYVGGSFRNTADFDPSANSSNQTSAGIEDGFVGKYDENGSLIWVRTYGGTFSDEVWALEMEGEKLYVAGAFEDSVSFGVGPGKRSNGDQDVFLLQADAQGNSRWVQSFGGSLPFRDDVPYALAVSQGQLYLAGQYTDTTDFDPGPGQRLLTTSLDRGAFISVFDTSGLFVDAAVYEAPLARDLALNNGQVLLCGNYRGAIDLAPGPIIQPAIPFGDDDLYLIRLGDPPPCNGGRDTLQITQCGPYQGPSGRIYPSSGVFNDTLPIGINCDSIFRLELTLLPTFRDTIPVTACDSFTWQNGLTYLQSGIYFDTLRTVAGCDSIVTLNLTINASARSSEQVTACDSFTWQNGFTYQQSGIYFDTLSTVAGCDSIVTLDLTINTSARSSEQVTACDSFIWQNGLTYRQSGIYFDTLNTVAGCDSFLTLDLSLVRIDTSLVRVQDTLISQATGLMYQWIDCNSVNAPIFGAIDRRFVVSRSGTYAVVLSQGACTDTSRCVEVVKVGLEQEAWEKGLQLFPNPGQGSYSLRFPQQVQQAELRAYNVLGQEVLRITSRKTEQFSFQLKAAAGIYDLLIWADGKRSSLKLIHNPH